MQENCTCGSVRGARGNLRPYRDQRYGPMLQESDQRLTASEELATDNEVRIHQGRWW